MSDNTSFSIEPTTAFIPFWRRFPSFFIYPMQIGTMLRLAAYSVFGALSLAIGGVFGTALHFIVWIVFLKYALMVMARTANGLFDEPDGLEEKGEGETAQVFRQLGLIGIIGLIAALLGVKFGGIGHGVGWLITSVLPPAGIMIIATQRSLLQALNPAQILYYIKTIGSPYLALCFILFSLTGSGQWVQIFLVKHMHSWLLLPLFSFVEFYFALIAYHMTGYVIYQYHDELGVTARVSFEQARAKIAPDQAADPVLTQLSALMAEGRHEAAADLLREELRKRWDNNDLHSRYQKLLVAAGKQPLAKQHARGLIAKLVSEKRMFQALDLCQQWLKVDPEFKVQEPNHVHELASAANVAKRYKLALDLTRDFDKKYPSHPHIPPVRLLTAKILSEHFHNNGEAMQILQTLESEYPTHATTLEARRYMKTLAKLAEIGQAT